MENPFVKKLLYPILRVLRQEPRKQRTTQIPTSALISLLEHAVHNPLIVVRTDLELMRRKFQAKQDVLSFVDKIERQMQRIGTEMELFHVLALEGSSPKLLMQKVQVEEVLRQTLNTHRRDLRETVFRISCTKVAYVNANPRLLSKAFEFVVKEIVEAARGRGLIAITIQAGESYPKVVQIKFSCNETPLTIPRLWRGELQGLATERILHLHLGDLKAQDESHTVTILLPEWTHGER